MELSEEIGKVITEMAKDMAVVMEKVLTAVDPWYAESNLVKELQTSWSDSSDGYVLELAANSYIYWLDQGRPPTSDNAAPSDFFERLVDWCGRRGISTANDVVYPIWQKIHREGYEGKHFMDDFWDTLDETMADDMDRLFDTICEYLSKEVFKD